MMRFLFILFIFISAVYGQSKKSEKELFIQAIKEEEISDQLKNDKTFAECAKIAEAENADAAAQKQATKDCYEQKIESLSEEDITKLADKMNLKSYDRDAAKSATSVKDYLEKRLNDAIYGKDAELKKTKNVSHDIYVELYESQVGKNILLEISQYCLENLGSRGSKYSVIVGGKEYSVVQYDEDGKIIYDDNDSYLYNTGTDGLDSSVSLVEFQVCREDTPKKCDLISDEDKKDKDLSRHPQLLSLLKRKLFEVAKEDPAKILGDRYKSCALKVKDMCEVYRCNNSYNALTPEAIISKCVKLLGLGSPESQKEYRETIAKRSGKSISLDSKTSSNSNGVIACNLESKLKDYRKTLIALEATKGEYKQMKTDNTKSFGAQDFDVDIKKVSKRSINELTSISSTELTQKVSEISGSEDKAKELKEKCFDGGIFNSEDEVCQELSTNLDKDKLQSIKDEEEVETAVYLKKIEELKADGKKEELDEFLKEQGLEKYVGNLADLTEEQMIQIVKDKYRAERMAAVNSLNERFNEENNIKPSDEKKDATDEQLNNVATQTLSDIKNHKTRVETLFQYSNIISSYLEVEEVDKDGKTTSGGSNYVSRNLEIEDLKKDKTGSADQNILEQYSSDNGDSGSSGNSDAGALVNVDFLDKVLGNTEDEKQQ